MKRHRQFKILVFNITVPYSWRTVQSRIVRGKFLIGKVFECLVLVRLGGFVERSGVLPTTQFAYRKGLDTCDALLSVSHTQQNALESGKEARIVQIDFSAAFDRVKHQIILYKLCSIGIGGPVMFISTQSLSNRSQHTVVDGCGSKLVIIASGIRREVFWARYCSSRTVQSVFYILENKLIGYAYDSTLMAVVPSPGVRVAVAEG